MAKKKPPQPRRRRLRVEINDALEMLEATVNGMDLDDLAQLYSQLCSDRAVVVYQRRVINGGEPGPCKTADVESDTFHNGERVK